MASYLDPKNDLIFKRIFGEHPDLLMSFLNALIPLEKDRVIIGLEYLQSEQVPDNPLKKDSIVDVKCKDNRGRIFIVEMQMVWSISFRNRLLFNAGKAYVKQLKSGDKYESLQPVYSLAILNENFDNDTEDYYHHFRVGNVKNQEEVLPGLEFVLVELIKFKPQTYTERKMAILWLRFLKEVGENMKSLPEEMRENEYIYRASELCREAAFTDAELAAYEKQWDIISCEKTRVSDAENKGLGIGLEKVTINGHKMGMSIEDIAKLTGLTPEQVIEILKREKLL